MRENELEYALRMLRGAQCLEDIFGASPDPEQIQRNYRMLVKSIHPDLHGDASPEERREAEDGFKLLAEYYEKAQKSLEAGMYGRKIPLDSQTGTLFSLTVDSVQYTAQLLLALGEVSKVFAGFAQREDGSREQVIIKLSTGDSFSEIRANNILLRREAEALKALRQGSDDPNLAHLPRHLAQFQTGDRALANIQSFCPGYDFYDIRDNANHLDGVEARHLFWILSRCLTTLGYVHRKGYIHGNLEPSHIIVNPPNHNVCIIDWCYALRELESFRACTEGYSAPEVENGQPPTPSSDIYSLGKSVIFLAGEEAGVRRLPEQLQKVLQWMTLPSAVQRPRDALELNEYLSRLRRELYGRHDFIVFPY